jgi:hypothetical protein
VKILQRNTMPLRTNRQMQRRGVMEARRRSEFAE